MNQISAFTNLIHIYRYFREISPFRQLAQHHLRSDLESFGTNHDKRSDSLSLQAAHFIVIPQSPSSNIFRILTCSCWRLKLHLRVQHLEGIVHRKGHREGNHCEIRGHQEQTLGRPPYEDVRILVYYSQMSMQL